MGGQAVIVYGGAEFSRDIDFAVAVSPGNLDRLSAALRDLKAEPIYFPPLSADVLQRGHACHYRCLAAGLHRLRIDLMSVMRGADPFLKLWSRRNVMRLPGAGSVPVMSLPDLVRVKKTQRDKDWPMIRRMVDADMVRAGARGPAARVRFWLRELRTPEHLIELTARHPVEARRMAGKRKAVARALQGDQRGVAAELRKEEDRERAADRRYWAPLRAELERWRLERRSPKLVPRRNSRGTAP